MNVIRLLALTLAAVTGVTADLASQPPVPVPVDGLLWSTNVNSGQSCPFVLANPGNAANGPYIVANGKLDRVKYNGYNMPLISFDSTVLFLYVTPLNAQGQPVATQLLQFQGTPSANGIDFGFNTVQRWDPKANNNMGGTVAYAGFPKGSYEVKVVAKIKLLTPAKEMPPTPEKIEKRDAVLFTSPFVV